MLKSKMYYKSASFYDLLNKKKDYAQENEVLIKKIEQYKTTAGSKLLDVACGTGEHISFLQKSLDCEGLDIDPEFLEIARKKLPNTTFHPGDMTSFKLPKKYDVITCLFSSIGYVKTKTLLRKTIENMVNHLVPRGLLIIEPWYTPETFINGHSTVVVEETESSKIVRMNLWTKGNNVSLGHSHILIMDASGIQHIRELHKLALFTTDDYSKTMENFGLDVEYDEFGLIGRGLFIGKKRS